MRISDWSSDVCSSDLNEIAHNKTANIIVSSYFSTGFDTQRGRSAAYDPYPQNIYVANNRFAGGGNDTTDQFKPLMALGGGKLPDVVRSEEHTSELQSLMRNSYAVFCSKTKNKNRQVT